MDNYTNNYLLLWVVNSCNFVQTCYINYVRHLIKPNKEAKMKLTEKQMIAIIKNGRISECTKAEKKQVMAFAFGEDYMESDDKGSKKTYKESK